MSRLSQWLAALLILAIIAVELWQNSVKWLFLCEVQWIAVAFLISFPLLALTTDRALLLGAYEIETWQEGFSLGLLLTLTGVSAIWSAGIELLLAKSRLHEPIGPPVFTVGLGILLVAAGIVLNLAVTHIVSIPRPANGKGGFVWHEIDWGMLFGVIVGVGVLILLFVVSWLMDKCLVTSLPTSFVELVSAFQSWIRSWLPGPFRDGYIGQSGDLTAERNQIGAIIALLVSFAPYFFYRNRPLPPLCSILLLAIVLVWLLSGFAFFFQAFRIPTLLPLLVWLWLSARHPKADHFYEVLNSGIESGPSSAKFLESSDPNGRIVVVAAAGGGIQAAAWTAQVLAGLTAACNPKQFQNSLRAVSGVSGGSTGLLYFLAAQASNTPMTAAAQAAAESSLNEVTHGLAYDDLCRAFFPFLIKDIYSDRGKALAQAWIENGRSAGGEDYGNILESATLRNWATATGNRILPAVILNSTIVEEGQRLAFSTVPLPTKPGFAGFSEFTTLYPQYDVPISTATRLSAAFTFVSPAARPAHRTREKELRKTFSAPTPVPNYENLHLVDGGYLDNSGITALVQLLHQNLIDLHNTSPDKLPKKILVLLVNAFPLPPDQYVKPHRGTFFQLWAPLLTLFTVRSVAHDALAQRELTLFKEAVSALHGIEVGLVDFRFSEALQRAGHHKAAQEPPPLSWHLTKTQKHAIINSWTRMKPEIDHVLAFLNAGVLPPWP
jgi:hypothetical protein